MAARGYAPHSYQQNQVEGADSHRLVVLLMQALVKFLHRAADAIRSGDYAGKAEALSRAQGIISELLCSLDVEAGGEVGANLEALYGHWQSELTRADLEDDERAADYVRECAENLATAWQEAWEKCRQQANEDAA